MRENDTRHTPSVSNRLPPLVNGALVALTLWFVLAAWSFASDGYGDLLLAVVSGFFLIVVAILFSIWRVWQKNQDAGSTRESSGSLRDWMSGEFDTSQGRLKGADAAVAILLPFMAVAFGMTAFAVVLHVTAHGAM
jgi:hypothetical protein